MNKSEFNSLLAYLKNRPSEAARLRDVLEAVLPGDNRLQATGGEVTEDVEWVTARVAGSIVGMSAKWVKEHNFLFPSATIKAQGGRQQWMYNKREIRPMYNSYINTL